MDSERQPESVNDLGEYGPLRSISPTITVADMDKHVFHSRTNSIAEREVHGHVFLTVNRILESTRIAVFMALVTVYALFADDLRLLCTGIEADDYFFAGASVCMSLFALDIALSLWVKKDYRFSYYFYLDTIATISMIPDIGWAWQEIVGTANVDSQVNQMQNAGRTTKAANRTSRIVRIFRLIRLVRLMKLYKATQTKARNKVSPEDEFSIPEESKIGRKLSELTTKRVVVVVMVLLLFLPLFELDFFMSALTSWQYGVNELSLIDGKLGYINNVDVFIKYHKKDLRPLIFFTLSSSNMNIVWKADTDPADLRLEEKFYASSGNQLAIFDLRYDTQLESCLSVSRTLFICIVLLLGALFFTKDANALVIIPIEKMIDKVKKIVKNPVEILIGNVKDVYDLEKILMVRKWWEKACCLKLPLSTKDLETSILENAILRIGALLAISFGEAGVRIIAENIAQGDGINPMVTGNKVTAIFGFCDVRNFTDTTEVLQGKVMTFINEIAEVLHKTVDHHLGTANKNIGDAFLLVWKLKENLYLHREEELEVDSGFNSIENIADLSVIAFLKVIAKINRNFEILKYREHAGLKTRIPGYVVKLGFALHLGWAIEGAIGSQLKIDASYLSPHVNFVMTLEEATKTYDVPILVSGTVIQYCSGYLQKRCRHLDTVRFHGDLAVRIYTYDLEIKAMKPEQPRFLTREQTFARHNELLNRMQNSAFHAYSLFSTSKYLRSLAIQDSGLDYIQEYGKAVLAYEKGSWDESSKLLKKCRFEKPGDVPTELLLRFMSQNNNSPPIDWTGGRPFPD